MTILMRINKFRIYKRALSDEEIKDLFEDRDDFLDDLIFEADLVKGYIMFKDPKTGNLVALGNLDDV